MYLITKYNKINLSQKIAQWLKALGAPSRGPGSIPCTHMVAQNHL